MKRNIDVVIWRGEVFEIDFDREHYFTRDRHAGPCAILIDFHFFKLNVERRVKCWFADGVFVDAIRHVKGGIVENRIFGIMCFLVL